MVSTHLKNISQIGILPQIGVKIKNIWNHHLACCFTLRMLEVLANPSFFSMAKKWICWDIGQPLGWQVAKKSRLITTSWCIGGQVQIFHILAVSGLAFLFGPGNKVQYGARRLVRRERYVNPVSHTSFTQTLYQGNPSYPPPKLPPPRIRPY